MTLSACNWWTGSRRWPPGFTGVWADSERDDRKTCWSATLRRLEPWEARIGAEDWVARVPYQPDIEAALQVAWWEPFRVIFYIGHGGD